MVRMNRLRIAMWSGPRNISTAMMRSWGERPDTIVCDEPLYAHYLRATGADHPGAAQVVEHHESDWPSVVARLTGPMPEGKTVFYQKHMTHHLLPEIDRGWLGRLDNCFLIRDPGEMLTSLIRRLPEPELADTGLPQQVEIFERVYQTLGRVPPVVDSFDVLTDPEGTLRALCDAVGLAFTDRMLSWPAGARDTDGIWAEHWYDSVEASTGFRPYRPKPEKVPARLARLHRKCLEYYRKLSPHRLNPQPNEPRENQ